MIWPVHAVTGPSATARVSTHEPAGRNLIRSDPYFHLPLAQETIFQ